VSVLILVSLWILFNSGFSLSRKTEQYETDIPHTALVILPMIFSKVAPSDELEFFLESWSLRVDPQLPKRYPQENWSELYSSTYKACELAVKGNTTRVLVPPISKPGAEIRTSSRLSGFDTMLRLKRLFKSSKS
jgi:hypothetical protein